MFLPLAVVVARSKDTNAGCCHDAIFQSTDQAEAMDRWTAEHGIQAEAVGVPVGQITADWNSPVVREALLHKGVGRRARRLHVQVQGAAAERRDADVH